MRERILDENDRLYAGRGTVKKGRWIVGGPARSRRSEPISKPCFSEEDEFSQKTPLLADSTQQKRVFREGVCIVVKPPGIYAISHLCPLSVEEINRQSRPSEKCPELPTRQRETPRE